MSSSSWLVGRNLGSAIPYWNCYLIHFFVHFAMTDFSQTDVWDYSWHLTGIVTCIVTFSIYNFSFFGKKIVAFKWDGKFDSLHWNLVAALPSVTPWWVCCGSHTKFAEAPTDLSHGRGANQSIVLWQAPWIGISSWVLFVLTRDDHKPPC